jgi:hypothetical protein
MAACNTCGRTISTAWDGTTGPTLEIGWKQERSHALWCGPLNEAMQRADHNALTAEDTQRWPWLTNFRRGYAQFVIAERRSA